jgi:hypothetical protein
MEVDHGMEQHRPAMTLATGSATYHIALGIDYRENFVSVIFHLELISLIFSQR